MTTPKKISRKEFLATIGSLFGLLVLQRFSVGSSAKQDAYGSTPYGGTAKRS